MERPTSCARRSFVLFSFALSLLAFHAGASAQTPRPALTDRVTDERQPAVRGARVTSRRAGTRVAFETTTDAEGAFSFDRLAPEASRIFNTNVFDRLRVADRSRGIIPGQPRLVRGGLKLNF
ncbi:MAG TPA: carboxypeptidase-like regulatory domain-containing protein [Pyrinomonadaceae bacterium]|nr:carboxypeptidase-like regulatory domain-containing protein [Pyrinomonadaceae bacterium]